MNKGPKKKLIGTSIVGPKGQIVIPQPIREMFNIESGDTIVLLADSKKGIALVKSDFLAELADKEMNKDEQ